MQVIALKITCAFVCSFYNKKGCSKRSWNLVINNYNAGEASKLTVIYLVNLLAPPV